jgi:hypothetical protein
MFLELLCYMSSKLLHPYCTLLRTDSYCCLEVEVEVGVEHPCGTCDQNLLPFEMLLSEICGLVSDERMGLQFAV